MVIQPQHLSDHSPKLDLNGLIQPNTSKSSLDTSGDDTSTTTDWNAMYDQFAMEKSDSLTQVDLEINKQDASSPKFSSSLGSLPICVHKTSTWLEDINSLSVLANGFEVTPLIKR